MAEDFARGEGAYAEQEILAAYREAFLNVHSLGKLMKVVVDCGNGIAGEQAPQALATLGCEVVPLFTKVDGVFPNHHPDPGDMKNLQDLIAKVIFDVKCTGSLFSVIRDAGGDPEMW